MRRSLAVLAAVVTLVPALGAAPAANAGREPAGPVLRPLHHPRSAPRPALVSRRLAGPAAGLGRGLSGEVLDLDSGRRLWARHRWRPVLPASNAKLLTAVAALRVLGPDARLSTRVLGLGHRVWLVGGNDVTLSALPPRRLHHGYPVPASLPVLARRTAAALHREGVHRVRLAADLAAAAGPRTAPGWRERYIREGNVAPASALEVDEGRVAPSSNRRVQDPTAAAVNAFARALAGHGIRVTETTQARPAPRRARLLAMAASPTVAALVQQMLTTSDNDLAEALARAVARARHRPGSFRAASAAVVAADRAAGIPLPGVRLRDGSGLSRQDRVPPATLVALLRLAASPRHPELAAILEGLPVAGFSGTLADRFRGPATAAGAGVIRAKTGTLRGANALSGYAVDRSGDLLAFSLLARHLGPLPAAESGLDRFAAALARCGCRRR